MSDEVNGSGGIPRDGREVEYATELWLADPSAFFLHPEGPLSDTTPEEWQAKQEAKREAERGPYDDQLNQAATAAYARYGNLQQAYYQNQLLALQSYSLQNQLSNQLLGFRLF